MPSDIRRALESANAPRHADRSIKTPALDAASLGADAVRTVEDYKHWIRSKVRRVFPHEMLASGFGHMHAGGVSLDYVVTVDFPMRHLEQLRNRAGAIDSPVLRRWIATLEPQLFEADHPWPDSPEKWLEIVRGNRLINIAAHGVWDTEACVASYHSFHRIPGRLGPTHAETLRKIAPIMHAVLCKVIEQLRVDTQFAERLATLSSRESEIASWVRAGKTNREIACLSKVSENTVKHHLTSVFAKLSLDTRVQLAQRLTEHESRIAPPGFGTRIV